MVVHMCCVCKSGNRSSTSVVQVLDTRFPDVLYKVKDVKDMPILKCNVDLATVTFPCDGTSIAGKRVGTHSGVSFDTLQIHTFVPCSPRKFFLLDQ